MLAAVAFALSTRVALGVAVLVVSVVGAALFVRQRRPGQIGGRMAPAKLLWLAYVLLLWFLVAPIIALDPSVARPLRVVLGTFSVLMWVRGLLELWLMYGVHRWRPPWGIAHDLVCAVVLTAQLALTATPQASAEDTWAYGLAVTIGLSLLVEAGYAAAFYRIVGRATEGEAAIWFASETEPRFRQVVRATRFLNLPFYASLGTFLITAIGGS